MGIIFQLSEHKHIWEIIADSGRKTKKPLNINILSGFYFQ